MKNLQELQNDELLNINGGTDKPRLLEGTEYWPESKNPVVAVANAAYNLGVIIGNAIDWALE